MKLIIIFLFFTSTLKMAFGATTFVSDDVGARISIKKPAVRIISLSPHVTELLFAVGAGKQVIAVSDYSDYPQEAKFLPSVGGAQGLDLERIAALKPDLVVAWQSGNSSGQLDAIARMGIPIFRSEPTSLEGIATSLERLGDLTGHPKESQQTAAIFRQRSQALQQIYANRKPVRVFYQIWNQPLMTVGQGHLISHLISLCGGKNIFEGNGLTTTLDAEAVVAANPEIMVTASQEQAKENRPPMNLLMWGKWPKVVAVLKHQYFAINPSLITRPTPRILEGAEQLCQAIEKVRK